MTAPDFAADPAVDLVMDGNAVAGLLESLFGVDVTAAEGECANCATVSHVGQLRAYTRGPGAVLRCGACGEVVMRIVQRDDAIYLDARGVVALRFARS